MMLNDFVATRTSSHDDEVVAFVEDPPRHEQDLIECSVSGASVHSNLQYRVQNVQLVYITYIYIYTAHIFIESI